MCIYRTDDGLCKKHSTDVITSYCVDGPCMEEALTNADRIRSMNDEELARQLVVKVDDVEGISLFLSLPTERMFITKSIAEKITLEWLKKIAE